MVEVNAAGSDTDSSTDGSTEISESVCEDILGKEACAFLKSQKLRKLNREASKKYTQAEANGDHNHRSSAENLSNRSRKSAGASKLLAQDQESNTVTLVAFDESSNKPPSERSRKSARESNIIESSKSGSKKELLAAGQEQQYHHPTSQQSRKSDIIESPGSKSKKELLAASQEQQSGTRRHSTPERSKSRQLTEEVTVIKLAGDNTSNSPPSESGRRSGMLPENHNRSSKRLVQGTSNLAEAPSGRQSKISSQGGKNSQEMFSNHLVQQADKSIQVQADAIRTASVGEPSTDYSDCRCPECRQSCSCPDCNPYAKCPLKCPDSISSDNYTSTGESASLPRNWETTEDLSEGSDDDDDDNASYCTDFFDLPYQNNEEYLELLHELEKKLIRRNKERVRKTMLEFERRCRQQNAHLCRPGCADDTATVARHRGAQKAKPRGRLCCCLHNGGAGARPPVARAASGSGGRINSDIMQNEKRWERTDYIGSVVDSGDVEEPEKRSFQFERTLHKSHWQLDSRSGEWVKVPFTQTDFCCSTSRPCKIRNGGDGEEITTIKPPPKGRKECGCRAKNVK